MHMDMHARLTACFADVHADVVSVRRVLRLDQLPRLAKELEDCGLLFGAHVEEVCDMTFGDDKDMSAAKGIAVISHISKFILDEHFGPFA